ncbi:beta strand repeat-containing protein [Agrobacterium vitis]|uniref:beta strand repeat-containing protein n=1 Tax=Agrobacterium vitis TaxID=373 RepID=UPI0012E84DB2|nr:hypothetical protein [Agrobacterium vitis]MVA35473.1 hypothetical protein [Agrobacterium vitis]
MLDLNGNGIQITALNASDKYFDMAGDGKQHRTAWAGAGDGVLVLDLNGSGKITQQDQVQFTAWDPTATSDMQALRDVFDTNHNGKLDAGDADWNDFKVMVTNADGSTTLKTLAQLGITSIDLTSNHQDIVLPDGSAISGETTFTKSDGSTGTAADAVFSYDPDGYLVKQTRAKNTDGTSTLDSKSFNANGTLASETLSTYSADGNTVTRKFDDNGDGVFNRTQTDTKTTNSDGSLTETIRNYDSSGTRLTSELQLVTAPDGKTRTILRDTNGWGFFDEVETVTFGSDGSETTMASDMNADGSLRDRTIVTTSADGLSKTAQLEKTGNGQIDSTQTDTITVASDGTRTETVIQYAGTGTAQTNTIGTSTTVTSANGDSKTTSTDLDGNGSTDLVSTSSIVFNADGSTTTTQSELNGDGTLRDRTETDLSANGINKTTKVDIDGDGVFDTVTTETVVQNSDGSGSDTTATNNANGSLRQEQVSSWSADGKTKTAETDRDGDGHFDRIDVTTIGSDGSSTETVSNYSPNGSVLVSKTLTVTSADGLTKTSQIDINGDGSFDSAQSTSTVHNSDGSSTVTVIAKSGANAVETGRTVTTTSANGHSVTIQKFLDGQSTADYATTDVKATNADGSSTETVTTLIGTSQVQVSRTVTVVSEDKRTTTVSTTTDNNQSPTAVTETDIHADGSETQTASNYSPDGSVLLSRTVTTTSADGLSVTATRDANGDGIIDATSVSQTVLETDGSTVTTVTRDYGSGTAAANEVGKTQTTSSANGLSVITRTDYDGNGSFDSETVDSKTLNADGSTTETLSTYNGDGSRLLGRTQTVTSANGLSVTTSSDVDGDGTFDAITTDGIVLNADGSKTETKTVSDANHTLVSKSVSTTNSAGTAGSSSTYLNGSSTAYQSQTLSVNADGSSTSVTSTYDANGVATSSFSKTISADGLSQSSILTVSGDQTDNRSSSSVEILNADGSTAQSFSDFGSGGALIDKTSDQTSADGLSTVTQWDNNGDGTVDYSASNTNVLNADGSTTVTSSSYNGDNSLHNRTVTVTSADKNSVTTTRDVNGDGAVDQTVQSIMNGGGSRTVVAMDGAVETASGRAFGSQDGRYETDSADGLTRTVLYDANGDGLAETGQVSTTTVNSDGSHITTILDETFSGGDASSANPSYSATVSDRTQINSSANGLDSVTKWDLDGSGDYAESKADVKSIGSDGSTTETISMVDNGVLTSRKSTTVSGNGLTTTTSWDATGSGTAAQQSTSSKVVEADGSTVLTTNSVALPGLDLSASIVTTQADGLGVITDIDEDGNGVFEKIMNRTVTMLADGSSSVVVSDSNSAGILLDKTTTQTSLKGRHMVISTDADGNGSVDQVVDSLQAVDGGTQTVKTNYNADGSTGSRVVSTTTADGLVMTTSQDLDGDGLADRKIVDTTASNADGSSRLLEQTYATSGTTASGATSAITPVLIKTVQRSESADGRTTVTTTDVNGDGSVDKVVTDVTHADGSKTTTTTANAVAQRYQSHLGTVLWHSAFAAQDQKVAASSIQTTDSTGMSSTVLSDYDGDGINDHQESWTRNIDGSQIATISDMDADGGIAARGLETITADGLTTILYEDSSNSGMIDHIDKAVMRADGSEVETISDLNGDGSVAGSTTTTISATGQTSTSQPTFQPATTQTVSDDNSSRSFSGSDDAIDVEGQSNQIILGNGINQVALVGDDNTIHETGDTVATIAAYGANERLEVSGRNNIATISNASVVIDNGGGLILSGGNDSVVLHGNSAVRIWSGDGNTVEISGYGTGLDASGTTISIDDGATVLVSGDDDQVAAHNGSVLVDTDRTVSGDELDVTGQGVNAAISGWTISVGENASGTVTGDDNAIALFGNAVFSIASGADNTVAAFGTNNTVMASNASVVVETGSSLTLVGSGLTIDEYTDASLTLSGSGSTISIDGRGTTATASNATIIMTGSADAVVTGGGDTLNVSGNSNNATLSGGTVHVGTATQAASLSLAGDGDDITLAGNGSSLDASGSGGRLDIQGDATVASISAATIQVDGDFSTIYGENNTITINRADASVAVWGDHNRINGNASGDTVAIVGTDETAALSHASVTIGTDSAVTMTGDDLAIEADIRASLTLSGNDNVISIGGRGTSITTSNATLVMSGSADVTVTGSDDVLNVSGSSNNAVLSVGSINIAEGAEVMVDGNNNSVVLNSGSDMDTADGTGLHDTVEVKGAGALTAVDQSSVKLDAGASLSLTGEQDTITMGQDTALEIFGANDNFIFHAGFGQDVISGYQASGSSADMIAFDHTTFSDWTDLLSNAQQSGQDVIITSHANDTLTLTNTSLSNLQQSKFSFS